MKQIAQARRLLLAGELDEKLLTLCGSEAQLPAYRERVLDMMDIFAAKFGADREIAIFSAPGRTELGGNHTDHQRGHVLAASVNLDILAVVAKRTDRMIQVQSEGYPLDVISLDELKPIPEDQEPHAAELIRGVVARFGQLGFPLSAGFDAYTTSQVLKGSGLSSSAAFEVLIGNICNTLYAGGKFDSITLAEIGQYAENVYYRKPCGLMDQMASSVGGVVAIDFANAAKPVVKSVPFDFSSTGYVLCIVDTGGNHADLTAEYASIPKEMCAVAAYFGKEVLSEVTEDQVIVSIQDLRKTCGDRAVLRALHFFREDLRAQSETDALARGDFESFLQLVQTSGQSSYCLLQNVYPSSMPQQQPVSIALAVGSSILGGRGAIRVHGGGFGGTIQAFVPIVLLSKFCDEMEAALGKGCCHVLQIRAAGGQTVLI